MRTALWRYLRRHHIALLALFLALGGTSYAASQIPANSVGTTQIKNKAVTLRKIDTVAQRTGGATGVRGAQGLAGASGLRGAQGLAGAAGHAGTNGATRVVVRTAGGTVAANDADIHLGAAQATCNAGEHATGGGEWISPDKGAPKETVRMSVPSVQVPAGDFTGPASAGDVPNAWYVETVNNTTQGQTFTVYVVCASP
jgi:hypothetical protein